MSYGACTDCRTPIVLEEFNASTILRPTGTEPVLCMKCIKSRLDRLTAAEEREEELQGLMKDIFVLSVSEYCTKHSYQDCSHCEKIDCGDNTNPLVTENKQLRDALQAL